MGVCFQVIYLGFVNLYVLLWCEGCGIQFRFQLQFVEQGVEVDGCQFCVEVCLVVFFCQLLQYVDQQCLVFVIGMVVDLFDCFDVVYCILECQLGVE